MSATRGLLVVEPGLLTTVQDPGRRGWAAFGVPTAGALDDEALRFANRLLGNAEDAAALEVTLIGPVLRAAGDLDLVVLGGAFGPAPGTTLRVPDGEIVSLAAAPGATRAIVAVAGGIDVPLVLGSRSTCVSGRFGGFQGRRLERGDFVPVFPALSPPRESARVELSPVGSGDIALRAFAGPDEDELDEEALGLFWRTPWRILPESNRMGFRLGGPSLGLLETATRTSEGTTRGTVQVTADGHPIVLLAERPTTGGYPRVAGVAAVDLGLLARTPPGRNVRFERITLAEARTLLAAREARVRAFPGETT